jgi:hypothetical protein
LFLVWLLAAAPVCAQDAPAEPSRPTATPGRAPGRAVTIGAFLAGSGLAFGIHESGHALFGGLFGADVGVKGVHFGPLPFFAITYSGNLSRREQFAISSAGFWMQHATSEVILTRRPHLRSERAPLVKGMLAFDILSSVAYAGAAFAEKGPIERDTRGMAAALGTSERWMGLVVLAPAVLDAWRYLHPDARWARWSSRGIKVGGLLLVLK